MLGSLRFLLPLSLLPVLSWAFPPTMDIGTFAIDNYSANGNGLPNLSYQIASGQNLYAAGLNNIPYYNSAAGSGTGGPRLVVDRRDTQVSKSVITNSPGSNVNREFCDFFFYGGHGLPGALYLGAAGGYGGVTPIEMNLGTGYTRWFLANGCNLFNAPAAPAATWQPAFKGLKAMLSFRSVVFDNNISINLYQDFWANWTWYEKSLYNAYFDAQANYGYAHLFPSKGLEPGCLSAQAAPNRIDYCQESYRAVERNYAPAAANSGAYYNRVIGSPTY